MSDDRYESVAGRLEGIAEELGDLAMDALRQAIDEGAAKRPDTERRLTQARRAVEKAAALLRAR